jgi:hypothetical protein
LAPLLRLGFRGKNGLLTVFSKAIPETNRVLGMALPFLFLEVPGNLI